MLDDYTHVRIIRTILILGYAFLKHCLNATHICFCLSNRMSRRLVKIYVCTNILRFLGSESRSGYRNIHCHLYEFLNWFVGLAWQKNRTIWIGTHRWSLIVGTYNEPFLAVSTRADPYARHEITIRTSNRDWRSRIRDACDTSDCAGRVGWYSCWMKDSRSTSQHWQKWRSRH